MRTRGLAMVVVLTLALACSGSGGGGGSGSEGGSGVPGVPATQSCDGDCPQVALAAVQVQVILAQAVAALQAVSAPPATIAVVDHVGNVLAVYQTGGPGQTTTITTNRATTGLEGFVVESTVAAISKAGTAAYLSTQGNAFTTRTAGQIVQENFNPGENFQPSGPLFGVQFSQLPCGDLVRSIAADPTRGPRPMPLGFSADPGGLPLYINGVPVGGIGVEFNGSYTIDTDILDVDIDLEERVATAATRGFEAPVDRRADRISVVGRFLRFADDEEPIALGAPMFDASGLVAVQGFFPVAAVQAGQLFLSDASGVEATTFQGLPAEQLVTGPGVPRYPPIDSTAPATPVGLAQAEVRTLLRSALQIARRARAQIRRPAGSYARVTISVVDLAGTVIGQIRTPDAPVFGIDVSLQKARVAAFFSDPNAAPQLSSATPIPAGVATAVGATPFPQYVTDTATFTAGNLTLANGVALANRSIGNLARPFFPDGIAPPNGPFSKPYPQWSPFSTGLQLELALVQVALRVCPFSSTVRSLLGVPNPAACPAIVGPPTCSDAGSGVDADGRLTNGIQIFPGSVPIYRGSTLIGGIGISGDGVDQDDMVAFLGLNDAGVALAGAISNAPKAIRADAVLGGDVRYVSCPPSPFLDSTENDPCTGK